MSLQITTQPTTEPVTVDEVRKILRLATFDDNDIIADAISAARDYVETVTWWSFAVKSYRFALKNFPPMGDPIELRRPPLLSVESVQYLDTNYQWQTWSAEEYFVSETNIPGLLMPKKGFYYPEPAETQGDVHNVRIDFTVGVYANHLPRYKQAIGALARHFYEHPEMITNEDMREMPLAISALIMKMSKPYYRF